MLTSRQRDALQLLETSIRETGTAPSLEEMAVSLGLVAKSGVHRILSSLEERGFIRRLPNRARAIEILRPLSTHQDDRESLMAAARSLSVDELETIIEEKRRLAA